MAEEGLEGVARSHIFHLTNRGIFLSRRIVTPPLTSHQLSIINRHYQAQNRYLRVTALVVDKHDKSSEPQFLDNDVLLAN